MTKVTERVDLSNQSRLREITDLLRKVSTIESPQELQRQFSRDMAKIYPMHAYIGLSRRSLAPGEYKITRLITSDEDRDNHHYNPWDTWHEIPINRGGFLGEVIEDDEPKLYRNLYLRDDPIIGSQMSEMGCAMAIPLFDDGEEILPGIAAIASHGHTPGHMSFEIRQGSNAAIVAGDAIGNHHVAFARPGWNSGSDQDPEAAAQTRLRLLDRLSHEQMQLVGFHLPGGGIGRVERTGDSFRFVRGSR